MQQMELAIAILFIPVSFTQMWTSVRAVLIDVEGASCATICLDPIAVNARRDMSTTRSGGRVWVGFFFFRERPAGASAPLRSASAPSHLTPAAAPV